MVRTLALASGVRREDEVVRDHDEAIRVKDLGAVTELALEDAYDAGGAGVVGHQDVHLGPHHVAGFHAGLAAGLGQDFLRQCLSHTDDALVTEEFAAKFKQNSPRHARNSVLTEQTEANGTARLRRDALCSRHEFAFLLEGNVREKKKHDQHDSTKRTVSRR
jgi:hypothetical protein